MLHSVSETSKLQLTSRVSNCCHHVTKYARDPYEPAISGSVLPVLSTPVSMTEVNVLEPHVRIVLDWSWHQPFNFQRCT